MSGTPVLSTIREGMAGTRIHAIRGILNGTANSILSDMARGSGYAEALAQAQALGYAEADPTDDVEGDDAIAKPLSWRQSRLAVPLRLRTSCDRASPP